jgi:hypothetical protein
MAGGDAVGGVRVLARAVLGRVCIEGLGMW